MGAFQGDWRVNLNFIETRTNVKVLSRPYIIVRDGESATINSGRQVPVLVESVSSDVNLGVTRNTIQYRNTGINLSVTPTINAEGLVSLEISQETSNAESAGQGELALAPVITSRSINTSVLALNGQTVVLGGLIQDNLSENDNNVPF
ncbi:type II secretion system protein GspD, partial [Alishewanella longhuensis]